MPEGDTVHTIAIYLRERILGTELTAGKLRDHPRTSLDGLRVADVYAHGKHLFIAFQDGPILRTHLGMYGSWHRYPAGRAWKRPRGQASVELTIAEETYVCFHAKEVELVRPGSVRERRIHTRLGPDLVARDIDLDRIVVRARRFLDPGRIAADVLLDQRVATGIGNVYKSELLFLAGIHPTRPLRAIADRDLRALYETGRELLRQNLGGGTRTTRFADDGLGKLWVYGRARRRCLRCRDRVQGVRLGATWRSTFWCPTCQPAP